MELGGGDRIRINLFSTPARQSSRPQGQTTQDAQALRSALLETMKSYPEPLNWAPFLIMGSDRP